MPSQNFEFRLGGHGFVIRFQLGFDERFIRRRGRGCRPPPARIGDEYLHDLSGFAGGETALSHVRQFDGDVRIVVWRCRRHPFRYGKHKNLRELHRRRHTFFVKNEVISL